MRVLINGAGVGGLATALSLHHRLPFLDISILKRANTEPPVNQGGLNLQPHAMETMHKLDLMEDIAASGWAPRFQRYYTSNGKIIGESPRGLEANPSGFPQISILGSSLLEILEDAVINRIGSTAILRDVEGVSYTQGGDCVSLECTDQFNNRFEIEGDILIGADGMRSKIRSTMLKNTRGTEDEGNPIKSGIRLFRGTAFVNKVLDGHSLTIAGCSKGKLVSYPLEPPEIATNSDGSKSQKQLLNFVVELDEELSPMLEGNIRTDNVTGNSLAVKLADDLEMMNDGFDLPFLDHRELFQEAHFIESWPITDRDPLESWCDKRVALIGDAAHPMYPIGSNRESTAILDAEEIASCIATYFENNKDKMGHNEICESLIAYEKSRLPSATSVQLACRNMLPEKVMDLVRWEVPKDAESIPTKYVESLQYALMYCQAGKRLNIVGTKTKKLQAGNLKPPQGCVPDGMKTKTRLLNADIFSNFSPMEKVILGANGILQDLIASMTSCDVVVTPVLTKIRNKISGEEYEELPVFMDREVHLCLGSSTGTNAVICVVTVVVNDEGIRDRMLAQDVSIGSLMREMRKSGKEPQFKLLSVGRVAGETKLTRQYELSAEGVSFLIYEEIDLEALLGIPPNNSVRIGRSAGANGSVRPPEAINSVLDWGMNKEERNLKKRETRLNLKKRESQLKTD